ncbi:hypothetical protein MKX03_010994 [Papaver bracteatum]|nr:hypothetical protein MKX03_010994 [Papaver bracteatum]
MVLQTKSKMKIKIPTIIDFKTLYSRSKFMITQLISPRQWNMIIGWGSKICLISLNSDHLRYGDLSTTNTLKFFLRRLQMATNITGLLRSTNLKLLGFNGDRFTNQPSNIYFETKCLAFDLGTTICMKYEPWGSNICLSLKGGPSNHKVIKTLVDTTYDHNLIYLQNNQFTGTLDVLANLPLENLNVENNQFIGWVPAQFKGIKSLKTGGNQWYSGPAPPAPPRPPRRAKPRPKSDENGNDKSDSNGDGKKSGLGAGGIAGILVALLVVVGAAVVFFLIKKKRSKKSSTDIEKDMQYTLSKDDNTMSLNKKHKEDHHFIPLASNEVKEMKSMQAPSEPAKKTFETTSAAVNLRPPPIERLKSFYEEDYSTKPVVVKKANAAPISATLASVYNLIGEGSIGRVYQAQFDEGKVHAVKKIDSSALPNQSSGGFLEIVLNISRLHHPNHGQHLLIYDFYKNGSLHDFLHLSDEYSKPLTWSSRVTIALGTARALEETPYCVTFLVQKYMQGEMLIDLVNPHVLVVIVFPLFIVLVFFAVCAYWTSTAADFSPPKTSLNQNYGKAKKFEKGRKVHYYKTLSRSDRTMPKYATLITFVEMRIPSRASNNQPKFKTYDSKYTQLCIKETNLIYETELY